MSRNEVTQSSEELAEAIRVVTTVESATPPPSIAIQGQRGFNELSFGVVRPSHALSAARSPDDATVLEYQDRKKFLATKAVETPKGRFGLLVLGVAASAGWEITSAYRLYGTADEIERLADQPPAAFQAFLERFGIRYMSKGKAVLFLPVVTAPVVGDPVETVWRALGLERQPGKTWAVNGSVRRNADGTVTLAWPFAIDGDAYRDEARRYGWRS